MKNTKMPAIRFKGFNDDWEQRKLGDVLDDMYNGQTPSRNKSEYWNGNIKWLSSGELNRGTVYDSIEMITENGQKSANLRIVPKGTFIMSITGLEAAGTRGNCALLGFDTTLNQSCMALFPKKDLLTSDFLFQWYRKVGEEYGLNYTQGTKQQSYNAELIKILPISLPLVAEQKKIASYLRNLDNLITLHQRKLEKIKLMKKSMLGKMFSRDAESIPKIRFDGYTDDWEQRKLGELYQRNTERNENLIGYDKTISVATMSYKDDGNGASESSLSTYKVLRVGDIAFEGHTNKQFRFGRFVVNDIGTGIMSPRFSTLRPLNEMPVNFWRQYIHSESVMRRILVNSTKAGTMMNELVIPEFLNQTIMVPSENEQAVIGQYFSNLDHLITLHQRKLEKLKKVKKSLLEHMFPMEK